MDGKAEGSLALSAAEQGRAIAAGRLDPVAQAEAYLAAIEAHAEGARIYARTTRARALAEAEAARARARDGRSLGPLDGVCVSWKDLFDTAGVATEGGSRMLAGRVPERDAEVVRRGTAAGTVCLGKTHLSELAFSGLGVNPMAATSPNRHGLTLAPGGSSSGAAASLAFGLAPLAIGSDTGGSVRIPAAWNNLVGLKTTAGLIPCDGALPLARSLDTVGPLAHTVEDAALGFAMLTEGPVPALGEGDPAGLVLFQPETLVVEGMDVEIAEGFEAALGALSAAGARIARGPMPAMAETLAVAAEHSAVVNYEGWQDWGETIEANPGVMFPPIETRFRSGAKISAAANARAMAEFLRIRDRVVAAVEADGLLVMPAVPIAAPPVAQLMADEEYYTERNLMALRNTRIGNLLGLAAITLPTRTAMAGLMLVGPPGSEARLLAAGHAVERALA
ncbi:MAG: amidase family protein [Pseudomonadota bacterium]